jgi:hypothetical protein
VNNKNKKYSTGKCTYRIQAQHIQHSTVSSQRSQQAAQSAQSAGSTVNTLSAVSRASTVSQHSGFWILFLYAVCWAQAGLETPPPPPAPRLKSLVSRSVTVPALSKEPKQSDRRCCAGRHTLSFEGFEGLENLPPPPIPSHTSPWVHCTVGFSREGLPISPAALHWCVGPDLWALCLCRNEVQKHRGKHRVPTTKWTPPPRSLWQSLSRVLAVWICCRAAPAHSYCRRVGLQALPSAQALRVSEIHTKECARICQTQLPSSCQPGQLRPGPGPPRLGIIPCDTGIILTEDELFRTVP